MNLKPNIEKLEVNEEALHDLTESEAETVKGGLLAPVPLKGTYDDESPKETVTFLR